MDKIKTTGKLFSVFGISRSGNHSIINWIFDSLDTDKVFFNDIRLKDSLNKRELYYVNQDKYFNEENKRIRLLNKRNVPLEAAKDIRKKNLELLDQHGWYLENENISLPDSCKNLIVSYENHDPMVNSEEFNFAEDSISKNIDHRIAVIIIRNPFNLIASRLMLIHHRRVNEGSLKKPINIEDVLLLWKNYANLFLNNTKIQGYDKTVYIKYDDWFFSDKYQKEISQALDLDKLTNSSEKVAFFGGGSSFDKFSPKNGKASNLKVKDRANQLLSSNDPNLRGVISEYDTLFKNHSEIKNLSNRIFN